MMKIIKSGILTLSAVIPAYLPAETSAGDRAGTQYEVKRLERSIKTTRIRNWVIKKKNEELNARMKDLESRIAEMRRSLQQEKMEDE
jgi:peptidoglycan hydrolase CwlO-like protein